MNYYNDNNRHICAWLRELIADKLISEGKVDERSITDVQPADLAGFTQCHFFAGIGGWAYALQLAGWPEDCPVWTGSCPCQPLSCAGQRKGHADERHLWPAFYRLIAECHPATVFGEQVAGKDGREWLAGVRADLEGMGYACGAAYLCAASVGAPHIRQRLYWVAESEHAKRRNAQYRQTRWTRRARLWTGANTRRAEPSGRCAIGGCEQGGLVLANGAGSQSGHKTATTMGYGNTLISTGFWHDATWHQCRDGKARRIPCPESIFQLESDGLWRMLGSCWNNRTNEIEETIIRHAKKTGSRPGEILLVLWMQIASKAIQRGSGGHGEIPFAEVLLFALCQFAGNQKSVFHTTAQDFSTICKATMRALWGQNPLTCSPQEQELARPSTGELGDTLHPMPPWQGTPPPENQMCGLWHGFQTAENVSNALPEVEKIWRSLVDEDNGSRGISAFASIAIATASFPLAYRLPGRASLLRGAGNAIVPQVASEFIKACLGD